MRREPNTIAQTNTAAAEETTPPPSVAVIVIGWNSAAYLATCLDSVLTQTHAATEVVYVDDASTDCSAAIAEQFGGQGVKAIRRAENGGMSAARMTGLAATTSTLLLFVDSDNVLPPDYLATMLADLGSNDFVYPRKQFFGTPAAMADKLRRVPGGLWTPPAADRARMWEANYADTCSLMRRSALLAAGGWYCVPGVRICADWHLFLRMSARGPHECSRAVLNYRVHAQNWSGHKPAAERRMLQGKLRAHAATITVATIYSGRMPGLWSAWMQSVEATLNAAGKTAELLIIDASPEASLPELQSDAFTSVHVRRATDAQDATVRRGNRAATAEFLAGTFNEALRVATGDVLWCIEDDTIVPENACTDLLNELLGGQAVRTAVGGLYRSRHHPEDFVAAHRINNRIVHLRTVPEEPTPVHFTGTGCLMLLRDRLKGVRWEAEWRAGKQRTFAHDWTLAWSLHRRGDPIHLVPTVHCRHHQTETDYV